MCTPILLSAISIGVGVAQSAMQFQAQSDMYEENQRNALSAQAAEERALHERQLQELDAARLRARQVSIKGAQERANAEVAGASRGMTGASIGNVLRDVQRQTSQDLATNEQNWEMTAAQLQREKQATITRAKSRINSVPYPSAAGAALGAIGSAVGGISSALKM